MFQFVLLSLTGYFCIFLNARILSKILDDLSKYDVFHCYTVWDRVPKEDAANFESDTFL